MDTLYGNTLIFKTLRDGFPTAQITILDNVSMPAAHLVIEGLAKTHDCIFSTMAERVHHWEFLSRIVSNMSGPVVILDPDVCLWENCEGWSFGDYLYAGRYIPKFRDEFTKTITESKVHPSFIWIDDCARLRNEIRKIEEQYFRFIPFQPQMFRHPETGRWHFHDTLGLLYHALKERVYLFTEKELNAYDHLFCGTSFKITVDSIDNTNRDRDLFIRTHEFAKGDYTKLRGIWRAQDDYFQRRAILNNISRVSPYDKY